MPSLAHLPQELRDAIWTEFCRTERFNNPRQTYDLLRTNKQIREELAPILYETVVFHLEEPPQALNWIHRIGPLNSSCIRQLVLKFSKIEREVPADNAVDVWSGALNALPSLQILTYEHDPSRNRQQHGTNPLGHHPALSLLADGVALFSLNPKARTRNTKSEHHDAFFSSPTKLRSRSITHAAMAIDEPIPEVITLAFKKSFQFTSTVPLQQIITGLPPYFFSQQNFHPNRSYAFIEKPDHTSMAITYRRSSPSFPPTALPPPDLPSILSSLPHLRYLRLGCPSTNSSFLAHIPPTVETLDVSFTDPDPERVVQNLRILHQRSRKLFTLGIAVSPLHDSDDLPDGGRQVNQGTPKEEESGSNSAWMPFWEALTDIQATGIRVWEGNCPGFRPARNQNQGNEANESQNPLDSLGYFYHLLLSAQQNGRPWFSKYGFRLDEAVRLYCFEVAKGGAYGHGGMERWRQGNVWHLGAFLASFKRLAGP